MAEITPWCEARNRDVIFRECVIGFLGGNKKAPADKYCEACKATGKNDCKTCSREIEAVGK